jgi:type II secretory ATPase GspE/PulE/Tfp pilus assembly ATPase PilB-like protein
MSYDLEQIYGLIDSILPFEACLYYQVLPLAIEGTRLLIGMVDPKDYPAEEYVRRQLAFINYSITTRAIDSEWHRNLLSQYLSHTAKHRQETPPRSAAAKRSVKGKPVPSADKGPEEAAATYIVDQPEELEAEAPPVAPTPPARSRPAPQRPVPESPATAGTSVAGSGGSAPLHLNIDEQYQNLPDARLGELQPKELMQALLSKVLQEGIGRLYFERQPQLGRILWSRDGVLQAVVGDVDALIFQGVINELKLLTHLSLISVRKPRQVEIERLYKGDRLLLRFRVMPGKHGEEATLQVLRGPALRFYQQQQIDKLGRDALDAAQMLQGRLNEIRDRARQTLNFATNRGDALPTIIQMLRQMERQVQEMIAVYEAEMAAYEDEDKG